MIFKISAAVAAAGIGAVLASLASVCRRPADVCGRPEARPARGWRYWRYQGTYATFAILMSSTPQTEPDPEPLYCPRCSQEVTDPLTCGDCSAVICRRCGTPLESPDELGMG